MPQPMRVRLSDLEDPEESVSVRVSSGDVEIPNATTTRVKLSDLQPAPTPQAAPPKRPSLLDELRAGLEPKPGEGLFTRSLKGPARALLGAATFPATVWNAATEPPEDMAEEAASVMPGGLLGYRLVGKPSLDTLSMAEENAKQGNWGRGIAEAALAPVPVLGPLGASLVERAGKGDIAGAITEGITAAGLPKAIGGVGRLARAGLASRPGLRLLAGDPARMNEAPPGGPAASTGTRAEIARYAADEGMELLPGQATEARPLQAIQAVAERSLAGEPVTRRLETQRARLSEKVGELKDKAASPRQYAGLEEIGLGLKGQIQNLMTSLKDQAQVLYERWAAQTGHVPIDTSGLQAKWGQRLKEFSVALQNTPSRYAGPIGEILSKASKFGREEMRPSGPQTPGGPPPTLVKTIVPEMTVLDMSQLRSAFWEVAHDFTGNVPERFNAIAAELVKDIDALMEQAARRTGTEHIWRAANEKWKQLEEVYNTSSSPLYRVLQQPDPSQVPGILARKGDIGGSPLTIRMAKDQGVNLGPLKRQVLQNIMDANFGLGRQHGGGSLGGYSDAFLRELFEPAELKELYYLGRVARAIRWEMNPSGTSNVGSALEELGKLTSFGLRHLLRGPAATKMTLDPSVYEATTGITSTSPRPAAPPVRSSIPKLPAAVSIGEQPPGRLLQEVRGASSQPAATAQPAPGPQEKKEEMGPIGWLKNNWQRFQIEPQPGLEEAIKKAEGEPSAYEKWMNEPVIPGAARVKVPGSAEFEAATGKPVPGQGAADWMTETAGQLNTRGMALADVAGRGTAAAISLPPSRGRGVLSKLEGIYEQATGRAKSQGNEGLAALESRGGARSAAEAAHEQRISELSKPSQTIVTWADAEKFLETHGLRPPGKYDPGQAIARLQESPIWDTLSIDDRARLHAQLERVPRERTYADTKLVQGGGRLSAQVNAKSAGKLGLQSQVNAKAAGSGIITEDTIVGCYHGCTNCYGLAGAQQQRIRFDVPVRKPLAAGPVKESNILRIGTRGDPSLDWDWSVKQVKAKFEESVAAGHKVSPEKNSYAITNLHDLNGYDPKYFPNLEVTLDPQQTAHMAQAMMNLLRLKAEHPNTNIVVRIRTVASKSPDMMARQEYAAEFANRFGIPVLETRMRFKGKAAFNTFYLDESQYHTEASKSQFKVNKPQLRGKAKDWTLCDVKGESCPGCMGCRRLMIDRRNRNIRAFSEAMAREGITPASFEGVPRKLDVVGGAELVQIRNAPTQNRILADMAK